MNTSAADALIAEFESLRQESFARLDSQRQAFNCLAVIAAAMIALIGAKELPVEPAVLLLSLPLVVVPLGFIFFDNELVLWCLAAYIKDNLRPELSKLVEHDVLLSEARRGDLLHSQGSHVLHPVLSVGRWLLFVVPAVLPIIYSIHTKAWNRWPDSLPFWPFFVADVALVLVLLWAVVYAVRCRWRAWHTPGKEIGRERRYGWSDRRTPRPPLGALLPGSAQR
jgi:uncharacterized membrane protein YvlD (DUF360 family)